MTGFYPSWCPYALRGNFYMPLRGWVSPCGPRNSIKTCKEKKSFSEFKRPFSRFCFGPPLVHISPLLNCYRPYNNLVGPEKSCSPLENLKALAAIPVLALVAGAGDDDTRCSFLSTRWNKKFRFHEEGFRVWHIFLKSAFGGDSRYIFWNIISGSSFGNMFSTIPDTVFEMFFHVVVGFVRWGP